MSIVRGMIMCNDMKLFEGTMAAVPRVGEGVLLAGRDGKPTEGYLVTQVLYPVLRKDSDHYAHLDMVCIYTVPFVKTAPVPDIKWN